MQYHVLSFFLEFDAFKFSRWPIDLIYENMNSAYAEVNFYKKENFKIKTLPQKSPIESTNFFFFNKLNK